MNLSLVLFTVGVIMITAGYTNQISPKCNEDVKIKVVPRNVYDEIYLSLPLAQYDEKLYDSINPDFIL